MNTLFSYRRLAVAFLICACIVLGCGKSQQTPMAPVSGMVTVDGQPLTSGNVSLHPLAKANAGGGMFAGQIDANGGYTIFTDGTKGAPLGKYKVTVSPSMVPTGGKTAPSVPFHPSFQNANDTKLTFEVVTTPAAGAYDLKLTKKK